MAGAQVLTKAAHKSSHVGVTRHHRAVPGSAGPAVNTRAPGPRTCGVCVTCSLAYIVVQKLVWLLGFSFSDVPSCSHG